MKPTTIIHNDSVKYLVLAIIVCNCIFIEIILISLFINRQIHLPTDHLLLGLVILLISLIAFSVAPRDWKSDVAFKITHAGLVDQSTYLALGQISWEDIYRVKRVKRNNLDQIRIYLHDSHKYRSKRAPFARLLLSIKTLFFGTPLVISGSFYKTSMDAAYAAIESHLQSQHNSLFVTH